MDTAVDKEPVVHEILSRIKIANSFTNAIPKLGWEVKDIGVGWLINLTYERPDTFSGQVGTGRGRKEFVPYGAYESGVVKTAWLLLELLVRHELMEAFMYDGQRIFNPHHTVADLALANDAWMERNGR